MEVEFMNNKRKVIDAIMSFIDSDAKCLKITGTHQFQKHVLALAVIFSKYPPPATILFRTNSLQNVSDFLSPVINIPNRPKTGVPINIKGGYKLFIDTINRRTWMSSPLNIDVAVVYPIDSLKYDEGDECVHDLLSRKARKIILVTWTDNKDFSWTEQFHPMHIVYDAEQEDPEYHQRVLEVTSLPTEVESIRKLPQYAKSVPSEFVIKIICHRCRASRWAQLNKPYPGKTAIRNAKMGEYKATCLKCGYVAMDNYNWYRQSR